MTNFNTLFQSLIRIIKRVLKQINPNAPKPEYHFYLDMIFGMMKSSSVILNNIAHSLNENINLKKLNYRLQRNLEKEINVSVFHSFISTSLTYLDDELYTFIVDDSDIAKPYGKAFESLAIVRDGSSLKNEYTIGYRMTSIVGITKQFKHPICLFTKIHNVTEKNYKSTNNITNQAIKRILFHLRSWSSIFIFDRGYDDQKLMALLNENEQYFLIRIKRNRVTWVKNKKSNIFYEAKKRKGKINIPVIFKGKPIILRASHFEGRIANFKTKFTIIITYLPKSNDPMILITNRKIHCKEDLIRLVLNYVSRWKVEEHYRFKKTQFNLEGFRVKSLTSINNLCFMLDIVLLILAHLIENQNRNMIYKQLITASKKLRDDIYIKYYQLISGIQTVFASNKRGVKNYKNIERWKSEEATLFNSLELKGKKKVRI